MCDSSTLPHHALVYHHALQTGKYQKRFSYSIFSVTLGVNSEWAQEETVEGDGWSTQHFRGCLLETGQHNGVPLTGFLITASTNLCCLSQHCCLCSSRCHAIVVLLCLVISITASLMGCDRHLLQVMSENKFINATSQVRKALTPNLINKLVKYFRN